MNVIKVSEVIKFPAKEKFRLTHADIQCKRQPPHSNTKKSFADKIATVYTAFVFQKPVTLYKYYLRLGKISHPHVGYVKKITVYHLPLLSLAKTFHSVSARESVVP